MTTATPDVFDLCGTLPLGQRLALEASAGTGKTFTLAGLVSRYVAETDTAIGDLLVVTFTRAAAAELRERIRQRLVDTATHLADAGAENDDALLNHLAGDDVAIRLARVRQAITDYDTANILTIHGFCQQVLATLGAASPHNPDALLVRQLDDIIESVCSDVLTVAALSPQYQDVPLPKLDRLARLTQTVLNNPGVAVVAPSEVPVDVVAAELVLQVHDEVRRRLGTGASLAYDDLLTGVRDALTGEQGAIVCQNLAARFPVALIDEFQDTDPVQWHIFSSILASASSTLVVVGDPKQAIYGFRAGDIRTYLEAAHDPATTLQTLGTNFRSDGAVIAAMNALCQSLTLGDPRIVYREVAAAAANQNRRLATPAGHELPALRIRVATHPDLPRRSKNQLSTDEVRQVIVADLANQVADLLRGTDITDPAKPAATRPLHAGDIAVLIRAHSEAAPIQRALGKVGVPSVITSARTVTETPAAEQWRWLLTAMVRPGDPWRARAAALSWFWGWSAAEVESASDETLSDIQLSHDTWATILRTRGIAALYATVRAERGVIRRVLSGPDGERNLTDLDHLAELLHEASRGRSLSPTAALALLAELDQAEAETDEEDPDATKRRIESDADAVQILTIHAAKGLEWGVVCCPSLWNPGGIQANPRLYFDPDLGGRALDAGQERKGGSRRAIELTTNDVKGENIRLAYVALTRARHQALVWWAPVEQSAKTGLARMLFPPDEDGQIQLPDPQDSTASVLLGRLGGLGPSAGGPGFISVEEMAPRATRADPLPSPAPVVSTAPGDLRAAQLGRTLDRSAGRWSFTAITRDAPPGDPSDESLGDQGSGDELTIDAELAAGLAASPPAEPTTTGLILDGVGAGPAFGTLVHRVLELLSFTSPDLHADAQAILAAEVAGSGLTLDLDIVAAGIAAAVATPLGPDFGVALADVDHADRLDELNFELPLGVSHPVATRAIGTLLASYLPDGDPLHGWASGLASGAIALNLGGHLTGSIDLVLRTKRPDGGPQFSVIDYKTNRLGSAGQADPLAPYDPAALVTAMAHHHYPLQALLYSVALHRYLRWRLPDYRPEQHLGPVGYLFLRGMVGPDTPTTSDGAPFGVYSWRPPSQLVPALSDLLHGLEASAP